jgi:hypothetical protein
VKVTASLSSTWLFLGIQVGQAQVLEDQRRQLVDADLGFVVVDAGLLASALALAWPTLRVAGPADHVADLRATLALADMLLLAVVVAEAILVERADRHPDDLLPVRGDDRLLADDAVQITADRLLDLSIMAGLIGRALAVQRPVLPRDRDDGGRAFHWRLPPGRDGWPKRERSYAGALRRPAWMKLAIEQVADVAQQFVG